MPVKRYNITLVFFKAVCHANPSGEGNRAGLVHILQETYFESSQRHLLTIMYRFEHINHDILKKILFENPILQTLFVCT